MAAKESLNQALNTPDSAFQGEAVARLLWSAVVQAKEAVVITSAQLDLPGPEILFVNPAFCEMTGYTQEEVLHKTPRILQGPKTDRTILKRLRESLFQGREFSGAPHRAPQSRSGSPPPACEHLLPSRLTRMGAPEQSARPAATAAGRCRVTGALAPTPGHPCPTRNRLERPRDEQVREDEPVSTGTPDGIRNAHS